MRERGEGKVNGGRGEISSDDIGTPHQYSLSYNPEYIAVSADRQLNGCDQCIIQEKHRQYERGPSGW